WPMPASTYTRSTWSAWKATSSSWRSLSTTPRRRKRRWNKRAQGGGVSTCLSWDGLPNRPAKRTVWQTGPRKHAAGNRTREERQQPECRKTAKPRPPGLSCLFLSPPCPLCLGDSSFRSGRDQDVDPVDAQLIVDVVLDGVLFAVAGVDEV